MIDLLRNQKFRDRVLQAAVLAVVLVITVSFIATARRNLVDQGIATGFDFLFYSTGWDIAFSLLDYTIDDPYWWLLLIGFLNTLTLGLFCIAVATVVGTLVGIARLSNNLVLNLLGAVHVELFRNVPLILQGFFWYAVVTHLPSPRRALDVMDMVFLSSRGLYVPGLNVPFWAVALWFALVALAVPGLRWLSARFHRWPGARLGWGAVVALVLLTVVFVLVLVPPEAPIVDVPRLEGFNFQGGLRITPEFAAIAIAIITFGSAYIAEIVRGGLLSVPRGQLEAAAAVGLRPFAIYWKVRIPLALRAIMPPLGNQYVFLMKATTIGIAIGFTDLFMITSTSINQSGQTIELLFIMMMMFLLINYTISTVLNAVNRRLALRGFDNAQ